MFSFTEVQKIYKEITLKGSKHSCFKGFALYYPNEDAFVAKREEVNGLEAIMFSIEPDFALIYDDYEKAFKAPRLITDSIIITSLFNIKGKTFCLYNV